MDHAADPSAWRIEALQSFDKETNYHYNYFRDYSPEIGKYIESDPILQLNDFITGRMAFIVPALIFSPRLLHPYGYVQSDPMRLSDPEGLGLLGALKCLYYGQKVSKFQEECKNECPPDTKGMAGFIENYANDGGYDSAILGCTCQKAGPELCADWFGACVTAPWGGGPKPRR